MSALRPYYISTQTTVAIGGLNSGTRVWDVIVGTAAASAVVTLYDGQDNTGVVKAVIDASAAKSVCLRGALFKNGCAVVQTGGSAKVTVVAE